MTLSEEFLAKGIVKIAVEHKGCLDMIKVILIENVGNLSRLPESMCQAVFNDFNKILPLERLELNTARLRLIAAINEERKYLKRNYVALAQNALNELVGNELVMQRNINLSIQLPGDDSSLLPVHCDTWSGDSPYEVVLWVPLVDCYGTNSMFFCDKQVSEEVAKNLSQYKDSEALYKAIEPHVTFMDVKYGEALIFTQNIMHGNRINTTNETRWSLNCRFKSLFSPYSDKKLGEFFEPVEIRPATKLGLGYEYPRL